MCDLFSQYLRPKLKPQTFSTELGPQILIDHVTEAVTHYKGRAKYYDVVNEAVCGCITWPGSRGANQCK